MRRMAVLLLIWLLAAAVAAQESACPAMQEGALANIAAHCAEQEAGTLCLGHATVTPVFRGPNEDAGRLQQPGDSISIADIDWLSISSEDKTWGTARALFPAYPADGLESRRAALLAFGNVALFFPEPAQLPSPRADVEVASAQGVNLRALPNTNARVIARLALSTKLQAIGRNPGQGWLLVYARPDLRGWISGSVVTETLEDLPMLEPGADTVPLWQPWQSFAFRSGIDDAPCEGIPASGILLQAPKFIAPRRFEINGVRLLLSGTAWLQAQVSSGMLIHVIDGMAQVMTDDGEEAVSSGKYTSIALDLGEDATLKPAGAPVAPAAYAYHQLLDLPIHALLYPARISLDVYTVVAPAPEGGGSPLERLSAADACRISAGLSGANIRSRPDPEASVIAVMAYRESAEPVARGIGADRLPWWKLAESIWIRVDATVSGGNCNDLPLIRPDN